MKDVQNIKKYKITDCKSLNGIVLGQDLETGDITTSNPSENVLVVGPTRCGKGVNTVMPTAFLWNESAIFVDWKGELWSTTSDYRKSVLHQNVINFSPFSGSACTAHWNPLKEIELGEGELSDVICIAKAILSPENDINSSWLLTGAIMHLLYKHYNNNLPCPSMADVLTFIEKDKFEDEMIERPYTRTAAKLLKNLPDKQYIAALRSVQESLAVFKNRTVYENTAKSDFLIRDLFDKKQKLSVYLTWNIAEISHRSPINNLFLQLLLHKLNREIKNYLAENDIPCKSSHLLLMLDEFAGLDKQDLLEIPLCEGKNYGLTTCIVCQSMDQLRKYDEAGKNMIVDNCQTQVIFSPISSESMTNNASATQTKAFLITGKKEQLIDLIKYYDTPFIFNRK